MQFCTFLSLPLVVGLGFSVHGPPISTSCLLEDHCWGSCDVGESRHLLAIDVVRWKSKIQLRSSVRISAIYAAKQPPLQPLLFSLEDIERKKLTEEVGEEAAEQYKLLHFDRLELS